MPGHSARRQTSEGTPPSWWGPFRLSPGPAIFGFRDTSGRGRLIGRPVAIAPIPMVHRGVSSVPDQFDVSLEDSDLLGEVELTTNLIIAASETDEHLTDAEIDEILGVAPDARLTAPASPPRRTTSLSRSRTAPARCSGPRARTRPGRGVSRITTSEPCGGHRRRRGTGRRRCRPGPAPGPRASVARVSALVRADLVVVELEGHPDACRRARRTSRTRSTGSPRRPRRAAAGPAPGRPAPACAMARAPQA